VTTDIMELWAEISAGALPEGVKVYESSNVKGAYNVCQWHGLTYFCTATDSDVYNRAAMLLIVDGWERQGKTFIRDRVAGEDYGKLEYYWDCCRGKYCLTCCTHERETIALGNVLAELGRAVKEGQS